MGYYLFILFAIVYTIYNVTQQKRGAGQDSGQNSGKVLASDKLKIGGGGRRLLIVEEAAVFRASPIPWFFMPVFGIFMVAIMLYQYLTPGASQNPPELWHVPVVIGGFVAVSLFVGLTACRSLRIDSEGVTQKVFFRTTRLTWRQIWDYGFSYAGFGRARLYFSEERLETDTKGRKLLSGRRCSIRLTGKELKRSGELLELCRKYTRIHPFLCTEEGRLEGRLKDRA